MNVYVLLHMSDRTFGLDPIDPPLDSEMGRYWTEGLNVDSCARHKILQHWQPIRLRPRIYRGKPNIKGLCDIHGYGLLLGFEHVISSRAREVFEREFPDSATYLRVDVEGVAEPYWVLWINTVLDAIDLSHSDVTDIAPGLKHVSLREYRQDVVGDCPMFRLPLIYNEPDHVTDRFRSVVERYELTNFGFWDRKKPGKTD